MPMKGMPSFFAGDVKLVGDFDDQEWANRLSLSPGVLRVDELHKGNRYTHQAFVPRDGWRPLRGDELTWLTRDVTPSPDRRGTVYLDRFVEMPDFSELRDVAKRYGNVAAVRRFADSPSMRQVVSDARERVFDLFADAAPLKVQGINVSEPGHCTTSLQKPPVRRYVGLHVDQWRDDEPDILPTASRLSFNIGNEARYFLMMNISVPAMRRMLDQQDANALVVSRRFLSEFPEYPVLRVKIEPGEGYLAVTRNIIHDATSADMTGIDLSVSFLGEFLKDSPFHERALARPLHC